MHARGDVEGLKCVPRDTQGENPRFRAVEISTRSSFLLDSQRPIHKHQPPPKAILSALHCIVWGFIHPGVPPIATGQGSMRIGVGISVLNPFQFQRRIAKLSLGREFTSLKIHSYCSRYEYVYEAALKRMRRRQRVPAVPLHAHPLQGDSYIHIDIDSTAPICAKSNLFPHPNTHTHTTAHL